MASSDRRIAYIGQDITLSAAGSSDAETSASGLTYTWDFGDQGPTVDAHGPQVTTSYTKRGYRTVTLTVTDPQGASSTSSLMLQIAKKVSCESDAVHRRGPFRVAGAGSADGGRYCDNRGAGASAKRRHDTVRMPFSGKALLLQYGTFMHGGSAQLFVDGDPAGTLDFRGDSARPSFGHQKLLGGFEQGTHRLEIVISGTALLDTFTF